MALKKEQKKFAKLFAKSGNHIDSYLKVFPKVDRKTAATNGKRWLNNSEVAAEILRLKTPLEDFPDSSPETQQDPNEIPPHLRPLEPMMQRYCEEYMIDLNQTQAAIRAGYAEASAYSQASELMRKPNIRHFIRKLMAERAQRTQVDADWVLQRLAIIAEAKITDFASVQMKEMEIVKPEPKRSTRRQKGTEADAQDEEKKIYYKTVDILETDLMPQHLLGAIASLKQGANGLEIKLHDPNKALELIGRHLSMWNDKLAIDPNEELLNLYKTLLHAGK